MLTYIIRRLLHMIPIIFGVALMVFLLFTYVGEDPVRVALGTHATEQAIADLKHEWGLDKPAPLQFLDFLIQIVTFDFGKSYNSGESLNEIFASGAMVSLGLTAPPYFVSILLFVSLALLISYYRGSFLDRFSTACFVALMSVSYLVYIIFFQKVLAYDFGMFPISGYDRGIGAVEYLMLPWIIMLIVSAGPDVRMYRTVFLDEIKADYVKTARAKGLTEGKVLFKHILKNAMIPILTYTIVGIPYLIMGAFLMERFFSIPGVGYMMVNAINTGDFPVLKGMTVLIAIGYSLFNLITDILYAMVDPRVKLE